MLRDRKSGSGASIWLAALALLLRALLPGGYMLAPASAHAFPTIVLCGPGMDSAADAAPGPDDRAPAHKPDRTTKHCAFAMDTGAAGRPEAAALPLPSIAWSERARPWSQSADAPSIAQALPPPTGPPALD